MSDDPTPVDERIAQLEWDLTNTKMTLAAVLATTGPVPVPWTRLRQVGQQSTITSWDDSARGVTMFSGVLR